MLEHAPYSPDFAPHDIFLSPELKSSLTGTHIQSTEDIHKKMAELLKALSQNDFWRCYEAWNACTGQYVNF